MGRMNFNRNVNDALENEVNDKKVDKEIRTESFKKELVNLINKYKMSTSFMSSKIMAEFIVRILDLLSWANGKNKEEKRKKKIEEKNNEFWYD